ncbi:MAG: PspA/IM30 family protein [Gammaproteobacteria bacterium]|nr:PspA/IM30 family protein [Gammaproteobacteria bacterium]
MALITRVTRLFTADVHAVLDRIEEPEVVLKQAIREMAEEVAGGEQRLRWLAAEQQQLEQSLNGSDDAIAALDSELDLCFEAGEEDLARSLVKRKLVAEQQHKQISQQLDVIQRDHDVLEATLAEQGQQLAEMQQKADLLIDTPSVGYVAMSDPGISQDAIDVAFLKEKRLREKGRQS